MKDRQKGVKCSVAGCDNWCRSKGLCPKHGTAFRRYGDVLGGKTGSRVGICKECRNEMIIIKSGQEYHRECYKKSARGKAAAYAATKVYRLRNREKILAV